MLISQVSHLTVEFSNFVTNCISILIYHTIPESVKKPIYMCNCIFGWVFLITQSWRHFSHLQNYLKKVYLISNCEKNRTSFFFFLSKETKNYAVKPCQICRSSGSNGSVLSSNFWNCWTKNDNFATQVTRWPWRSSWWTLSASHTK